MINDFPESQKPKILAIDDNEDQLIFIGALLEQIGCDVKAFSNPARALDVAAKQNFDLVVLDLRMPEMDGYQTLSALRRGAKNQDTPVLVLTVADTMKDVDSCFRLGANGYLTKPIDTQRLKLKIRKLLSWSAHSPASAPQGDGSGAVTTQPWENLRSIGGDRLVKDVIRSFLIKVPELIAAARGYCLTGNFKAAEKTLYSLKSHCANLHLMNLFAACEEIELLVRSRKASPAADVLNNLTRSFANVKPSLEQELERNGGQS
ncbi:MAG: response regulator [Elusimicrobia bacterium]|nr:response regulator [Elusimicrobiota bacterium]